VLLEAGARRARFLSDAVRELGLSGRAEVLHARAEVAGRDGALRAGFEVVTARSFGPPAVVAECAAPLLRRGGHLIVAEPPAQDPVDNETPGGDVGGVTSGSGTEDRWPPEQLRKVGLEPMAAVHEGFSYHVLRQAHSCPDRYPRRDGVPAKRPLF
jgi:16S rRNA (guanine527-N7)-methyltransferase